MYFKKKPKAKQKSAKDRWTTKETSIKMAKAPLDLSVTLYSIFFLGSNSQLFVHLRINVVVSQTKTKSQAYMHACIST